MIEGRRCSFTGTNWVLRKGCYTKRYYSSLCLSRPLPVTSRYLVWGSALPDKSPCAPASRRS